MPNPPSPWDDLRCELDTWQAGGAVAALWWRDDDAADASPALDRLLALTERFGAPLALAVPPALAMDSLGPALAARTGITVLQHGFEHRNHAQPGASAVECGGARPVEAVLEELRDGYARLRSLVGERFAPVLAPPWNRIEPQIVARLGEVGFRGLSAFGRREWHGLAGLTQVNAHVDPLRWPGGARFGGEGKVLGQFVAELARRRGGSGADEPLGLLTHHRDHDAGAWEFLERLLEVTTAHPAARWLSTAEAFALPQLAEGPAR